MAPGARCESFDSAVQFRKMQAMHAPPPRHHCASLLIWLLGLNLVSLRAADDYKLGPDSMPQEGVPLGEVTKYHWSSNIFPGTERDYWVYVPKQYDPARAACVMVFQDGGNYVNTNGQFRV